MAVREKRCGCDCHNQTVEVSQAISGTGTDLVDAPCCDAWPDGTPCRYAVLFECFHDWPLWETEAPCGRTPFGVTLNFDGSDYCLIPNPLGLTYPATELIRECVTDVSGECVFTNRLYNNNTIADPTHMAPSVLTDQFPNAVANKFPPYHTTADGIRYHRAEFGRSVPIPGYGSDTEVNPLKPSCQHEEDGTTLWELKIGTTPATLEWVYDEVLNNMQRFGAVGGTGANVHRPRYVAETTWDLWGRNTMHLQNPEDWPSLKRRICVVALSEGSWDNPCNTHEEQCACCDTGFDAATLTLNIAGCGRLAGTSTVSINRQFGTPGYCGVSEPDAPCGWFWTELGTGGSNCPASGTGPLYSGNVGLMIYCDGTEYHIDVYCYRSDTDCWESAGAATITNYECTCDGPSFSFTLPTLACCCEDVTCSDCTDVPDDLTVDLTSNCFGTATIGINNGGSGRLWTGSGTSSNADTIDIELDLDECTFSISCNGSLASVVDISDMVVSCEPFEVDLQPTVTFIAGCCTGPLPPPDWSGSITE